MRSARPGCGWLVRQQRGDGRFQGCQPVCVRMRRPRWPAAWEKPSMVSSGSKLGIRCAGRRSLADDDQGLRCMVLAWATTVRGAGILGRFAIVALIARCAARVRRAGATSSRGKGSLCCRLCRQARAFMRALTVKGAEQRLGGLAGSSSRRGFGVVIGSAAVLELVRAARRWGCRPLGGCPHARTAA